MSQISSSNLCWYSLYFNNDENKLSNKIDEKNIEKKINDIEKDYYDKLNEIEKLCLNTNNNENENENEIANIKSKSSLAILQKELEIVELLAKYSLQNKKINYTFFISSLNILLEFSETLRKRIGLSEFKHEDQHTSSKQTSYVAHNSDYILRCSYKFCSYKDNCSYNYNFKTKSLCYQDHYVHHMVSADLKYLINYVKLKFQEASMVIRNNEILKTINTLSFVIRHMESELKNKCFYLPENEWESCHYVKNK